MKRPMSRPSAAAELQACRGYPPVQTFDAVGELVTGDALSLLVGAPAHGEDGGEDLRFAAGAFEDPHALPFDRAVCVPVFAAFFESLP